MFTKVTISASLTKNNFLKIPGHATLSQDRHNYVRWFQIHDTCNKLGKWAKPQYRESAISSETSGKTIRPSGLVFKKCNFYENE